MNIFEYIWINRYRYALKCIQKDLGKCRTKEIMVTHGELKYEIGNKGTGNE